MHEFDDVIEMKPQAELSIGWHGIQETSMLLSLRQNHVTGRSYSLLPLVWTPSPIWILPMY
jgi:hypothetical protein